MIDIIYKRTIVCDICGLVHRDVIPLIAILDARAAPPLPTGWTNRDVTMCPICVALKKKH